MTANIMGLSLTVRRLIVVIFAVVLAVFVARMSLARIMVKTDPALALTLNPRDARAMAAMAEFLVRPEADPATLARATRLARAAVIRDATTASGIRTLGLLADLDGNRKRAKALFNYAALTSLRDLPTQLWLIQEAVDRDDTTGALQHFDLALRSSFRSADVLFPVLVSATEDDRLLKPITDVLARQPWWANGFLVNLVSNGKATSNILAIFSDLGTRRVGAGAEPMTLLINRLVKEDRFREARLMFNRFSPKAAADIVQNRSFEREPNGLPFDWILTDTQNLRAERGIGSDGKIILRVHAGSGASGVVAKQLLVLGPGQYQVIATLKDEANAGNSKPETTIACTGTATLPANAGRMLANVNHIDAARTSFVVPAANCQALWLTLNVTAGNEESTYEGEISRIDVVTLRHD